MKDKILAAIRDSGAFTKLVLSGNRRERKDKGEKTLLEPAGVGGDLKYRIVSTDGTSETTKVIPLGEIADAVTRILQTPFRHLHLLAASGEMHVRISKKGRYLISRGKGPRKERLEVRDIEQEKARFVTPENSRELLSALGMLSHGAKIKTTMFPKFRQINRFIELACDLPLIARAREGSELRMIDFGCGKAYLTFALYHHLHNLRGIRVSAVGVDRSQDLIAQCNTLRQRLHYDGLEFHASDAAAYAPSEPPDIVLSLHACDLATDEAIAKGINLGAAAIIAVPCCQHELHHAIEHDLMKPILRHGILRERVADILTDAFRALVLRALGYKAEVMEFIDPAATSKNIMIRALRADSSSGEGYAREFKALCDFWHVRPKIVEMLDPPHRKMLEKD